jgi:uncharacterized protein involved in exopolysaccharide biosynthesis
MLQKYSVQEQVQNEEGGQFLSPAYFIDVLKRRLLYFLIPFVLIFAVGATAVMFIPAVYVAEGKILVETQQIPSDLVRSTVNAVANERVVVIGQRILTRDNLLAIANKYQLFSGRRKQMTGTEMVDMMRASTQIKPVDLKTSNAQNAPLTLAFTVGFEHEQPVTAMRVAAEFVTMILSEDVRVRTNLASETTKFLEREVKRLEAELNAVEVKIAEARRDQVRPTAGPSELQLNTLRAELMQKAATYSDQHPDMKVIKQKIAALEKPPVAAKESEVNVEALERQQAAVKKNLETTGQKLTAARLGESLERGQQSERLEIIEQPTLPLKPIRPNRTKLLGMVFGAAAAAGGGLVVVLELLQSTIYRTADILRVADSHLVVTIPYIATDAELQRRRMKIVVIVGLAALGILIAAITSLFFLPPLDILFDRIFAMIGI